MKLAQVKGIAGPGRKVDGMEGTRIVLLSMVGDKPVRWWLPPILCRPQSETM